MNPCCLICNSRTGVPSVNTAIILFGEHNNLPSGKTLSDIVSEIIDKPVNKGDVHSDVVCKQCCKTFTEYDSLQIKLEEMKDKLQQQFKRSILNYDLTYENYTNSVQKCQKPEQNGTKKSTPKRLVLPASKLQPVSPDLLLKVGNLAAVTRANMNMPVNATTSTPTLNLTVTVGSSVLTQTINTTTANRQTELLATLTKSLSDFDGNKSDDSASPEKNSLLSFNVNSLPKDFLSSVVIKKVESVDQDGTDTTNNEGNQDSPMETSEQQDMETNEQQDIEIGGGYALSVVPVPTDNGDLVLEVEGIKPSSQSSGECKPEYIDLSMLEGITSSCSDDFILGKLRLVNDNEEHDDDDDDDDDDEDTLVVDSENGSILRMVRGQKFLYSNNQIELVMPDGYLRRDSEQNGDSQDSNDESQIELQVSGDEETANAIIAAAQERGGAFIKVESGEMYRVKSVQSKSQEGEDAHSPEQSVLMVRKEGKVFRCLLCERNKKGDDNEEVCVGNAETIMLHLKMAHDARIYICQLCGIVMRKRREYTVHIAEHAKNLQCANRNTYECGVCHKNYNSRTLLAEHMNVHSGERPYACHVCHKRFASKYTHQAHLKTHSVRPRPYKCDKCAKAFLTPQNLVQHRKTHTGVKEFICQICNKAFSTQHNLEVHAVVHSGARPHACTHCGKAFARKAEVRDHMRIHTGERPFKCDICGARFTQSSNLHSHKRATHLDDKRYHCEHCPKRFKRRRLLEYHIKSSHTGERPLKCDQCGASFVYPEHYKKHMRIHSGEKPYNCEICGKSFKSPDNRNTHRFVHSDKKPYECLACGAGYMRKQQLYNHMTNSGHLAESIVVNQPRVTKMQNPNLTHYIDINGTPLNIPADEQSGTIFTTSDELILKTSEDNLGDQTEIMVNDEDGETVRLVQIKMADGKEGWIAVNN